MNTLEHFRLASGREIGVHRFGPEPGDGERTIVFCHAAPGSGAFDPVPHETERRGVTILAPDRPGYGHSAMVRDGEWATVDRAADDIAEILDRIETGRVGVVGWSAGGRVALALAARHPDRVDRVVVVATPAPDEEVPWIPPEQKAGIDAMRGLPAARVHAALGEQLMAMVPADPRSPEALGALGYSDAADATL
jgi:pimeloyl-ACP methyl ester carboxylesterase